MSDLSAGSKMAFRSLKGFFDAIQSYDKKEETMTDQASREAFESEIIAIEKALDMVSRLCQPRGTEGARSWTMSIPARPDYDPDLVIGSALQSAKAALTHANTEMEKMRGLSERKPDVFKYAASLLKDGQRCLIAYKGRDYILKLLPQKGELLGQELEYMFYDEAEALPPTPKAEG